jgi:CRP-like cAMP-binding protein
VAGYLRAAAEEVQERHADEPLPGYKRQMIARRIMMEQRALTDSGGGGGGGGGMALQSHGGSSRGFSTAGSRPPVLAREFRSAGSIPNPGSGGFPLGSSKQDAGSELARLRAAAAAAAKIITYAHAFRVKAQQVSATGGRARAPRGTGVRSGLGGHESTEERERRKITAVHTSSMRHRNHRDSGVAREDRAKRIMGGWRLGSTSEYFLAWREVTWSLRDIQQARDRVKTYVQVLATRGSQRTDAELETLYGFVVEKDARFRQMPRYEAMELCRRMRVEDYGADEVVVEPGDLDCKVFILMYGAASEWAEEAGAEAAGAEEAEDVEVARKREKTCEALTAGGLREDAAAQEEGAEGCGGGYKTGENARHGALRNPLRTFVAGQSFGVQAAVSRLRRTTTIQTDEATWFITLDEPDYQGTQWESPETAARKRMDFLCRLPCFDGASLCQLSALVSTLTEHRFEPGTTVMNQGQECTGVYVMLSGTVALIRRVDTSEGGSDDDDETLTLSRAEGECPAVSEGLNANAPRSQDAYRKWRRQCEGAATSRGPGVCDVQVRTVGPFGLIGGQDCCKRSPSHFYAVVRGDSPATVLFLSYQNFYGKFSNKAIAHFAEHCLHSPTDQQLRQCLREKRLAQGAERRLWEVSPPDNCMLGPCAPPAGYAASAKRAVVAAARERCALRHLEKSRAFHRQKRSDSAHAAQRRRDPEVDAGADAGVDAGASTSGREVGTGGGHRRAESKVGTGTGAGSLARQQTTITTTPWHTRMQARAQSATSGSSLYIRESIRPTTAGLVLAPSKLDSGRSSPESPTAGLFAGLSLVGGGGSSAQQSDSDDDVEEQVFPPMMATKEATRSQARGRRDAEGYAAASHRGLVGWPFQRGVYNPGAAPLAGITGGGYTPSVGGAGCLGAPTVTQHPTTRDPPGACHSML